MDIIQTGRVSAEKCIQYNLFIQKTKEFNLNIKKTTKFAFILVIIILVPGLSSCDRAQQVAKPGIPQTDPSIPMEERDHVWAVDQNGIEVPVPGTWVLVSHTNLNSTSTIGESFILPPDPPHKILISDGTYTDGAGILWTKVRITTHDGDQWQFLERVDTSVSPHRLYVVVTVDENGLPTLAYGEYPFDLSGHNVQIWEKQ